MTILDNLRSILRPGAKAKPPAAAAIRKAIAEAEAERSAALAELTNLDASRLDALLDPSRREAHGAAMAAARQRGEDLGIVIQELQRQLEAAETAEDEAAKRKAYDAALAARDVAVEAFRQRYPELARGLADLQRATAEVDLLIEAANAALPAGAPLLETVEGVARARLGKPRRDLKTTIVELWAAPGGDHPLPPDMQSQVQPELDRGRETGRGFIRRGDGKIVPHGVSYFVKRKFERIDYRPATNTEWGDSLSSLTLPGLAAGDPYFMLKFGYRPSPAAIIEQLDVFAAEKPIPAEQPGWEVEYRLVRDEPPAAPPEATVPPAQHIPASFGQPADG